MFNPAGDGVLAILTQIRVLLGLVIGIPTVRLMDLLMISGWMVITI
jgi:hypothetical protein